MPMLCSYFINEGERKQIREKKYYFTIESSCPISKKPLVCHDENRLINNDVVKNLETEPKSCIWQKKMKIKNK